MSKEPLNGQIRHPFRCLVAGPSECGKSTFVRDLLMQQSSLIDTNFDYITIVLGTDADRNETLSGLKNTDFGHKVDILELNKTYKNKEDLRKKFSSHFKEYIEKKSDHGKKSGCVIFDDLMSELSECGLLVDLFTKYSSHYGISTIHITQNIFFSAGGKNAANHVTIYRNCHMLVLFNNVLDNTVMINITKRLSSGKNYKELFSMFTHILDKHRYLVIFGDKRTPPELKYRTDIFQQHPVLSQTVYGLTQI